MQAVADGLVSTRGIFGSPNNIAATIDCASSGFVNSPGEARQAPLAEAAGGAKQSLDADLSAEGARQPHPMDPTAEDAGQFSKPVPSADASEVATQASMPTIPSTDTAKSGDDCKSSKGLFSGSKKRKRSTAAVSALSGQKHTYIYAYLIIYYHNIITHWCAPKA